MKLGVASSRFVVEYLIWHHLVRCCVERGGSLGALIILHPSGGAWRGLEIDVMQCSTAQHIDYDWADSGMNTEIQIGLLFVDLSEITCPLGIKSRLLEQVNHLFSNSK